MNFSLENVIRNARRDPAGDESRIATRNKLRFPSFAFARTPLLVAIFCAITLTLTQSFLCPLAALAQSSPSQTSPAPTPPSQTLTSSRAESSEEAHSAPSQIEIEENERIERFKNALPPSMRHLVPDSSARMRHQQPVLSFKRWANEKKRFIPTFLFCMFAGLIGTAFFPSQIAIAQECCRNQFWRSLGRATLVGMITIISVIVLDRMLITKALANLLIAVLELTLIAGLSVGISLIGDRVMAKTGLDKNEYLQTHPRLATIIKVLIGSLLIALIVQIPGAGKLPRIGIRIATLIAILGSGGLLKTKYGTTRLSSQ